MLSQDEQNEILHDYISGDTINKFFELANICGYDTQHIDLYLLGLWDMIPKIDKRKPYMQILSDRAEYDPSNPSPVMHWVLFKYMKKDVVHVYDSLNREYVSEQQNLFLCKALRLKRLSFVFQKVQNQPNGMDCGVFAMAFSVSLLFNRDIINSTFIVEDMRPHLLYIFNNLRICPFPTNENPSTIYKSNKNVEMVSKSLKNVNIGNVNSSAKISNCQKDIGNYTTSAESQKMDMHDASPQINQSLIERSKKILNISQSANYDEGISEHIYETCDDDEVGEKYCLIEEVVVEYDILEVLPNTKIYETECIVELIQKEHSYYSKTNKKCKIELSNSEYPSPKRIKASRQIMEVEQSNQNDHSIQNLNIEEFYCGKLNHKCMQCSALHFKGEVPQDRKYTQCCHKGKVVVQKPKSLDNINQLITNTNHSKHKHFMTNIRRYNSALSFASCGAQIETLRGSGPYCYKIHGQIYHKTSHVQFNSKYERKYAQLYFMDSDEALVERLKINANKTCDELLLKELDAAIRAINPYAQGYKMLKEVQDEQNVRTNRLNTDTSHDDEIALIIRKDRNVDCRRYNVPNCSEVAVVFQSSDGTPPFERDIRVYPKTPNNSSNFIDINVLSCNLDPMCYTLMFPHGEPGWQPNWISPTYARTSIAKSTKPYDKITMLQYKKAMISISAETENPILNYGKLLQQWLVDSYVQVEAINLNYVQYHQNDLRVESYKGLMDYIKNRSETNDCQIGKQVILPSSFEGSARNMRERYLDAMAICSKFGTPDLFITFTCNPKWKEITENLLYSQTSSDRPDLISRVFSLKLKELLHDVVHNGIFGSMVAYVYTIEFQKRGLPHAHMLFILKNKLINADEIDKIVCAEIPDPLENPYLYEIVKTNMIHGPCGTMNPEAYCMENGKCVKGFPKSFEPVTCMDRGGYPAYRRRNNNISINKNGHQFDNRYLVPYNKYLSMKYNAHINVEVCSTVKSVKYIFKYIYKGFDCATVEVLHNGENFLDYDEIQTYLNCRYISACEAAWKLFECKMHDKSHHVNHLQVHLPDEHNVVYHNGGENTAIKTCSSTLLAWFELNKTDVNSCNYKYIDIPHHYVFNKKDSKWIARKSHFKVVPRLYSVNPKNRELFYLRMLLLHCKGATSYNDIKTVDGVLYDTFEEAASAKGLIRNNEGYIRTLDEMSKFEMPAQMRNVFCYICIFCTDIDVSMLWLKFCDVLSEDLQMHYDYDTSIQKTLEKMDEIFQIHNSSCEYFNLPINRDVLAELHKRETEIHLSNAIDQQALMIQINSLNEKQSNVFNEICLSLDNSNPTNKCFFIDGPGGCGKTYLYNTIIQYAESKNKTVLSFATTGIAATLLKNGRTLHSGFKLPIPLLDNSSSFMKANSKEAERLKRSDVIIIDECSMMDTYMLECIDRLLQFIMQNDVVFGNKIIIIGGDFRQTLPVIPRAHRSIIIERCLKSSRLWRHFVKCSLTENLRCSNNPEFNKWLLTVGDGTINDKSDTVILDSRYISNDLIRDIYGNDFSKDSINAKIIVCVKNEKTLKLNNKILSNLIGNEVVYYSTDSVESDDPSETDRYPIDFLYSLTPSGMPPHELHLKVGCVVMLIRNINVQNGLCNGIRLIVNKLHKCVIECEIITGPNTSDVVFLPQIDLIPSDTTLPFKLKRSQFPVIPAFAITINKSQGQTFDHVGVDLTENVFSHGQLYTALSRVSNQENLKILLPDSVSECCTKNIVYKEVL